MTKRRVRARKPTHGGSRTGAGQKPQRGTKASVVITVRLTLTEAAELDAHLLKFPGVTRAAFAFAAVMLTVWGERDR